MVDYERKVRRFAKVYAGEICHSMRIFSEVTEPVRYELFYEMVFDGTARKTGMNDSDITYLSHPFHWILFNKKDPFMKIVSGSGPVSTIEFLKVPKARDLVDAVMNIKAVGEGDSSLMVEKYKAKFNGTHNYRPAS